MKENIQDLITKVNESKKISDKIKTMFVNAINNTFTTTIKLTPRGDAFVITGDIDAMWLRDSSGQIRPLFYIESEQADELIKKVIKRQWFSIEKDSYANAFNIEANGRAWTDKDITDYESPWVWERKYELDSIAYIMQTAHLYYEKTADASIFDEEFLDTLEKLVDQIALEQRHENSPYIFERPDPWAPSDSLRGGQRGTDVAYTGMSWTGFRPSDDSCVYQYLIPSNAFTVVSLRRLAKALEDARKRQTLCQKMFDLSDQMDEGIKKYGLIELEKGKKVFAYEVDGLGNSLFMDDANVPSLLSLAYLEYLDKNNPLYLETRRAILSEKNPLYFSGKFARGIGSDHTPKDYIWHIALAMQWMTSNDENEEKEIIKYFETTDAGTNLTHEGFHKDDPNEFTRKWFSWSNSMFCEAVLRYIGLEMIKKKKVD
ncbi:MAG: glycoside hydrolase family 125 protein [Tissierellia bacterium]|nr:glycoside hydrolase family 125 protein [Tissierellia bacterium]